MKTSYHYFPFIVISLLLHYLFFYFNSDRSSNDSTTKASSPIKTTEEHIVATTFAPTKAMPTPLLQLDAIQSMSIATSTRQQQTTQTEKVTPSISPEISQIEVETRSSSSQEVIQTEVEIFSSTAQVITQAEIEPFSSTSQVITQAEIEPFSSTSQVITQAEIEPLSSTSQEVIQAEVETFSSTAQVITQAEIEPLSSTSQVVTQTEIEPLSSTSQVVTQTEIEPLSSISQVVIRSEIEPLSSISREITQTELIASLISSKNTQIEQSKPLMLLPEEDEKDKVEKVLPIKSYQVNIKTHTSGEVALLKEYVFEQNRMNLPKVAISKPTKKKKIKKFTIKNSTVKSAQPVVPTKKSEITARTNKTNKTNQQKIALSTKELNNKTSTLTKNNSVTIEKRIFKPKSDAMHTSMASQGNSLQQAIAVSGKAPSYPKQAALQHQKGQVVANMTVTVTGSTKEAEIVQSSGHEVLDKEVLSFIAQERFMPALKGQEKVSSKQSFYYRFE